MTPSMEFDRAHVIAWIEEATHTALGALDPLPDQLIAHAEELDVTPAQLRLWIFDQPKFPGDWSGAALARWIDGPRRAPRADEEETHG